jgi:hypothetical protein
MARFSTFEVDDLAEALAKADKLKSPWSDGTSCIILSGHELLENFIVIVQLAAGLQK